MKQARHAIIAWPTYSSTSQILLEQPARANSSNAMQQHTDTLFTPKNGVVTVQCCAVGQCANDPKGAQLLWPTPYGPTTSGHILPKNQGVIMLSSWELSKTHCSTFPIKPNWELLCLNAKNAHCVSLHSIGIPSNPLLEETHALAMWPHTSCLWHHMAVAENVFLTPWRAPLAPRFWHCPEKCRVRCERRGKLACFYFVRICIFYIPYEQYVHYVTNICEPRFVVTIMEFCFSLFQFVRLLDLPGQSLVLPCFCLE